MKLLNQNILDRDQLDFTAIPSDNKADSICSFHEWGLDFDVQEYMKANYEKEKGDLFSFFKNAFKNDKLKKHDPKFTAFKCYYGKLGRKSWRHNFSEDEIRLILEVAEYRKPSEIAMDIFPESLAEDRGFLNKISADIKKIIDAFGIEYEGPKGEYNTEKLTDSDYRVPETEDQILKKIQTFVPESPFKRATLDAHQKKCIRFLRGNLNSTRFLKTINGIRDVMLRRLFEEEFIKAIHDKPDLIPEDINGYITLCEEYVVLEQIKERYYILSQDFKRTSNSDSKEDMANRRGYSDELSTISRQVDECKKRIAKSSADLAGSREKRLKDEGEKEVSIFKYVIKLADFSKRAALVQASHAYRESLLETINEIKAADRTTEGEVHGISVNEILGFSYTPLMNRKTK